MRYPILYSFRRCPYAIRARMALVSATVNVVLREISLASKPVQLLIISTKGTVPVLQLTCGQCLEESVDIMKWALSQNDPMGLLESKHIAGCKELIDENDQIFKVHLDYYKYHSAHPEKTMIEHRKNAELFICKLDSRLQNSKFLMDDHPVLADIAIFPFVRQFAGVDKDWFYHSPYKDLRLWLNYFLESYLFLEAMVKLPMFSEDCEPVFFPNKPT